MDITKVRTLRQWVQPTSQSRNGNHQRNGNHPATVDAFGKDNHKGNRFAAWITVTRFADFPLYYNCSTIVFPCFVAVSVGSWLFPSVSSRTTKARALRQWEQPTSQKRQGQRQPSEQRQPFRNRGRFRQRQPTKARALRQREQQPSQSRQHQRATIPQLLSAMTTNKGKGVAIPFLRIPFPPLRLLALSL